MCLEEYQKFMFHRLILGEFDVRVMKYTVGNVDLTRRAAEILQQLLPVSSHL
jgi:hypothetical protein